MSLAQDDKRKGGWLALALTPSMVLRHRVCRSLSNRRNFKLGIKYAFMLDLIPGSSKMRLNQWLKTKSKLIREKGQKMRKVLRSLSFLITVILLAWVAASPIYAQPAFDPPGLDVAIAAQERHTDDLLEIQGVVGTAVGLGANGQAVVKIYTEGEGVAGLPRSLDGVPVRVQVTGRIFALDKPVNGQHGDHGNGDDEQPVDPTAIGVSSGTERLITVGNDTFCTTGTLGARVTDGPNVFALSNAHVYALEGSVPVGNVQVGVNGDIILHPGRVDMIVVACGSQQEIDDAVIGNLEDFVDLKFPASDCDPSNLPDPDCNTIDAAIASTTTALVDNATPADGYGTPKSATVSATINQKVKKYGRSTSQTKGRVTGINATVDIGYDSGDARFVNQIIIEPGSFSAGGDSGALIVVDGKGKNKADDRKPVGLLFAGNPFITIANPIDPVLTAFGVAIDGE